MKIKSMIAAACGATLLACASANAATIERSKNASVNLIYVFGRIEPGDDAKLSKILLSDKSFTGDKSAVVMDSPGGNLEAGIKMAMMIHARQLATLVPEESSCASVCAMMWLGGSRRLVADSGQIGFHAASDTLTNRRTGAVVKRTASAEGTGMMLKYYNWLGLPAATGQFLVSESYRSVHWISGDELKKYGIEAYAFNKTPAPGEMQPGTSAPALPPELQPKLADASANPTVPVMAKADPLEDLPFIAAPKQDAPVLAPSRIEQPRRVERPAPRRVRVASRGYGRSCGIGIPLPYIGGITLRVRC
jgi:hypothetical protein